MNDGTEALLPEPNQINLITLILFNTTGMLTLSPVAGQPPVSFSTSANGGVSVQGAALTSLSLTSNNFSISFGSAFSGMVQLQVVLQDDTQLLVGGDFTGSVAASWQGQAGGAIAVTSGAALTIAMWG